MQGNRYADISSRSESWIFDWAFWTDRTERLAWLGSADTADRLAAEDVQWSDLHRSDVLSVAFSPDGTRIASGGFGGTIRLWDLDGQQISDPIDAGITVVSSIAFSPDGEKIVSGASDHTVRLWDLSGRQIGSDFTGHTDWVRSVAFSPDGQFIVSGGDDSTIRLWDLDGKQVVDPFVGTTDKIESVAFSPDGTRIVSGSQDGSVQMWDLAGQQVGKPFFGHNDWVRSVAFSPDGQRTFSAGDNGSVLIWDLDGQRTDEFEVGFDVSLAISPDGSKVVTGAFDGLVRLWEPNAQTGWRQIGEAFEGHKGPVRGVAFSPNGDRITSVGKDGTVRLWDLDGQQIGPSFTGHTDWVQTVAVSPDGTRIVTGSDDETIRIWDFNGNQIGDAFTGANDWIQSVAISPDNTRIASAGGSVLLWNFQGELVEGAFQGAERTIYGVDFSPDGTRIASGGADNFLRLWELDGQQIGGGFAGHQDGLRDVAYSPDGTRIVTGSDDGTVRFWDQNGRQIGTPFEGHTGSVRSVAFSPDGTRIASAGGVSVKLWDLNGQLLGDSAMEHDGSVHSVAFNPNGTGLVSGGGDGTVRIWDLNGQQIGDPYVSSGGSVLSVTYTPDGSRVIYTDQRSGTPNILLTAAPRLGPPIWTPIAWIIAIFLFGLVALRLDRSTPPQAVVLEDVLAADTPISDPKNAGEALNNLTDKVSGFLLNPRTGAPFTVALTGDWGAGKSSAMTLIRRQLDASGYPTIWFNAWHHQKEEHLFAALMQEVRRNALPGLWSWRFFRASSLITHFRLFLLRMQTRPLRFALLAFIAVFAIVLLFGISGNDLEDASLGKFDVLRGLGGLALLAFAISQATQLLKPFKASAGALVSAANRAFSFRRFEDNLSFRDQFATAFQEVTRSLGCKRLTIFIDDLDRCNVDQVVDIMEAINFLTSSGKCYIILGIHEDPVRHALGLNKLKLARAHAIASGHPADEKDEIGRQRDRDQYAELYLEKLLNIRIVIPKFDGASLSEFIDRAVGKGKTASRPTLRQLGSKYKVPLLFSVNLVVLFLTVSLAIWAANLEAVRTFAEDTVAAVFSEHEEECAAPDCVKAVDDTGTGTSAGGASVNPAIAATDATAGTAPIIVAAGTVTTQPAELAQRGIEEADVSNLVVPTEPDAWTVLRTAILNNPFWVILALFVVLLPAIFSAPIAKIWVRYQAAQREHEQKAGRRDTDAFEAAMRKCLPIIHDANLTPRALTRYVNMTRYLTAGLGPDQADLIDGFVYLTALQESQAGKIQSGQLNPEIVNAWAAGLVNTVRDGEGEPVFTAAPAIPPEVIVSFNEVSATVKFPGQSTENIERNLVSHKKQQAGWIYPA